MFKAALLTRFSDVHTDQFHSSQLQTARQRRDESLQSFADRCRDLAQKIAPQSADARTQKIYNDHTESIMLTNFISSFSGTPGKQVKFVLPGSIDEVLRIFVTVNQEALQERNKNPLT
jgi:hypothetical protein